MSQQQPRRSSRRRTKTNFSDDFIYDHDTLNSTNNNRKRKNNPSPSSDHLEEDEQNNNIITDDLSEFIVDDDDQVDNKSSRTNKQKKKRKTKKELEEERRMAAKNREEARIELEQSKEIEKQNLEALKRKYENQMKTEDELNEPQQSMTIHSSSHVSSSSSDLNASNMTSDTNNTNNTNSTTKKKKKKKKPVTIEEDESCGFSEFDRIINVTQQNGLEQPVLIHGGFLNYLKPHQMEGIRFCWKLISQNKGCILAHSMGLGKTLQMVALSYLYVTQNLGRKILIVCPKSVILNWKLEYEKWLSLCVNSELPIYLIDEYTRTHEKRLEIVKDWSDNGGVLILSFNLFHRFLGQYGKQKEIDSLEDQKQALREYTEQHAQLLQRRRTSSSTTASSSSNTSSSTNTISTTPTRTTTSTLNTTTTPTRTTTPAATTPPSITSTTTHTLISLTALIKDLSKNIQKQEQKLRERQDFENAVTELITSCDLVIVDEAHRMCSNADIYLNRALVLIKTKQRIALTGTPIQNNLMEYYSMINWVKEFHWTREEFFHFFSQPIQSGMRKDSDSNQIEEMKKSSFLLVHELESFVHRKDQRVLRESLPPKYEYVISFRVTPLQAKLYQAFAEARMAEEERNGGNGSGMGSSHFFNPQLLTRPLTTEELAKQSKTLFYLSVLMNKITNHPDLVLLYCHKRGLFDMSDLEHRRCHGNGGGGSGGVFLTHQDTEQLKQWHEQQQQMQQPPQQPPIEDITFIPPNSQQQSIKSHENKNGVTATTTTTTGISGGISGGGDWTRLRVNQSSSSPRTPLSTTTMMGGQRKKRMTSPHTGSSNSSCNSSIHRNSSLNITSSLMKQESCSSSRSSKPSIVIDDDDELLNMDFLSPLTPKSESNTTRTPQDLVQDIQPSRKSALEQIMEETCRTSSSNSSSSNNSSNNSSSNNNTSITTTTLETTIRNHHDMHDSEIVLNHPQDLPYEDTPQELHFYSSQKKKKHKSSLDTDMDDAQMEQEFDQFMEQAEHAFDASSLFWAAPVLSPDYQQGDAKKSAKMEFLIRLIEKCYLHDEKILVFSQYTETLSVIEKVFSKTPLVIGTDLSQQPIVKVLKKGEDYFRLDGSVNSKRRQAMIDAFTPESQAHVFLISTKAGGLGINLTAATRVVIYDVSWNDTWDKQALFRTYRFGQTKPVYVYRLVTYGSAEEKIFNLSTAKAWLARRVVDDQTPDLFLKKDDLEIIKQAKRIEETLTDKLLLNPKRYQDDEILKELLGTHWTYDSKSEEIDPLRPVHVDVSNEQCSHNDDVKNQDLMNKNHSMNHTTSSSSSSSHSRSSSSNSNNSMSSSHSMSSNSSHSRNISNNDNTNTPEESLTTGEFNVERKIKTVYPYDSLFVENDNLRLQENEQEQTFTIYEERRKQVRENPSILLNALRNTMIDGNDDGMMSMMLNGLPMMDQILHSGSSINAGGGLSSSGSSGLSSSGSSSGSSNSGWIPPTSSSSQDTSRLSILARLQQFMQAREDESVVYSAEERNATSALSDIWSRLSNMYFRTQLAHESNTSSSSSSSGSGSSSSSNIRSNSSSGGTSLPTASTQQQTPFSQTQTPQQFSQPTANTSLGIIGSSSSSAVPQQQHSSLPSFFFNSTAYTNSTNMPPQRQASSSSPPNHTPVISLIADDESMMRPPPSQQQSRVSSSMNSMQNIISIPDDHEEISHVTTQRETIFIDSDDEVL